MNILITGLAGTGKSLVVDHLQLRGFRAVDASSPEWSTWRRVRETGSDADGPRDEWVWQESPMRHYLTSAGPGFHFVGGCAANQGEFRDGFDHVVLLVASLERMLERLAPRWDLRRATDRFERYMVGQSVARILPLLRESATFEIDTSNRGVEEIIDLMLEGCGVPSSQGNGGRP